MYLKKKILFICTHNSARSQMAEGFINSLWKERYEAFSCGTNPGSLSPYAVEVMKEIGIDISHQYSKGVEIFKSEKFDYVVTVCDGARDNCPFFPGGVEYIHEGFEDPTSMEGTQEERLNKFREVRDKIFRWLVKKFGGHDVP